MRFLAALLCAGFCASAIAAPLACNEVVRTLSLKLKTPVDEPQLTQILSTLSHSGHLPGNFVTKREAQSAGWRPGSSLSPTLPGKSMGGDRFGNYEHRLPNGLYKEADLDYRGGKRGGKRLIFGADGRRYVTVDHYQTFTEIPPCQ